MVCLAAASLLACKLHGGREHTYFICSFPGGTRHLSNRSGRFISQGYVWRLESLEGFPTKHTARMKWRHCIQVFSFPFCQLGSWWHQCREFGRLKSLRASPMAQKSGSPLAVPMPLHTLAEVIVNVQMLPWWITYLQGSTLSLKPRLIGFTLREDF